MRSRDRLLIRLYLLVAAGALIATWSQNLRFFLGEEGGGLGDFVSAAYANPAAASLTNDVLFMVAAAWILIWVEGRRLRVRHLWIYFVLSGVVAVSVAFPLFLAVRQRAIALSRAPEEP